MGEMLLFLTICVGLFALGDLLGVITKAKVSSVFVALMAFLVLFMTGAIPADIIDRAGLSQIAKWASPVLVFHMGTMIDLKQLIQEWKTVVVSLIAMLVAIISIFAVIPIIGKEAAIVSIPVINGGIVATQIMTERALELGLPMAAAFGALIYAVQKFIGTPPASMFGLKEAEAIVKEHRENKKKNDSNTTKDKKDIEVKDTILSFANDKSKYFTTYVNIFLAVGFAYLSTVLGKFTGINYSIWALLLGASIGYLGIIPKKILDQAKTSGFLTMVVFASIIPSLAKIKPSDLITLSWQTIVVFGAVLLGTFIFMYILPTWKIIGSKNLTIGIAMAQLLGFPATFLIVNEIATAVAEDDEEKELILNKITPAYVVAGFASVTTLSVIIAGIFVEFL